MHPSRDGIGKGMGSVSEGKLIGQTYIKEQ